VDYKSSGEPWLLRFSQRFCYRLISSVMQRCVFGRILPDVSIDCKASIFRVKQPKETVRP